MTTTTTQTHRKTGKFSVSLLVPKIEIELAKFNLESQTKACLYDRATHEYFNPLCGDGRKYTIQFDEIRRDDVVDYDCILFELTWRVWIADSAKCEIGEHVDPATLPRGPIHDDRIVIAAGTFDCRTGERVE